MSDHPLQPLFILDATLRQRVAERPQNSYVTKLLDGGIEKMGAKIREEAEETIEAAPEVHDADGSVSAKGRAHFVYECGDLFFHAMVLMAASGVSLAEVAEELGRRHGTSGLVEKANRPKPRDNGED